MIQGKPSTLSSLKNKKEKREKKTWKLVIISPVWTGPVVPAGWLVLMQEYGAAAYPPPMGDGNIGR